MEVIATKSGFYGMVRDPGDVFDVADGSTASWFVPTKTSDKAPDKALKQKPRKGADPSSSEASGDDPII